MGRIIMMVVFLSSLISCSTGSGGLEPITPPIVNKTPTILTNFTDTTVVFGDTVKITGTVKDYTSLLVNNEKADAINVPLATLTKETVTTINAINKDVSATKTVTVHVGDWTTSFFGLCTHGIWVEDPNFRVLSSSGQFIRNGTWIGSVSSFELKPFGLIIDYVDGKFFSSFDFTWDKGRVRYGNGSNFLIKSVNKDKLIILSEANDTEKNLIEETYNKQTP